MRSRSISASAAIMWKKNRPTGVAEDRDVIISDIIYTAVLLHLGEAPPSAAA